MQLSSKDLLLVDPSHRSFMLNDPQHRIHLHCEVVITAPSRLLKSKKFNSICSTERLQFLK
ncbi:hypothetical protein B0H34DRAFT_705710 [Crassisporium funariophilum]|nr:hypothetical protein B0H34DRAFT_705684 [Crassisporium funariophilum]KAF8159994.1 hypothetical protein B0H34DRAFT_705710 [Crassisporium funariophilum]